VALTSSGVAGARWFEHACRTTASEDLEDMLDALEEDLALVGLRPVDIVRNRLFAASREGRDAASAVRFGRLSGHLDPARFGDGDGASIQTLVLSRADDEKIVVEYDPPEPPCRFVAVGRRVFLSGLTSTRPTFADQLDHISARAAENLGAAARTVGAALEVVSATAFVHRDVDLSGWQDVAGGLGLAGVAFVVDRCAGFSRPGKLIELELDAISPG
jgi:enamine deaminase RidA (YjgF/YER057c/UK114 family)